MKKRNNGFLFKLMGKMKISTRLTMGFAIMVILSMICGGMGIYYTDVLSTESVDSTSGVYYPTQYTLTLQRNFGDMRYLSKDAVAATDKNIVESDRVEMLALYDTMKNCIRSYKDYLTSSGGTDSEEYKNLEEFDNLLTNDYVGNFESYFKYIKSGDNQGAIEFATEEMTPAALRIKAILVRQAEISSDFMEVTSKKAQETNRDANIIISIVMGCSLLISLIFAYVNVASIKSALKHILDVTESVANGELNVTASLNGIDEISDVSRNVDKVISAFNNMSVDLNVLTERHAAGDIEAMIDVSVYKGDYNKMVVGINDVVSSYVNNTLIILDSFKAIAGGDFEADLVKFPGKKALANDVFEVVKANLISVSEELVTAITAATNGNLELRSDASKFEGDWAKLISNMNNLLNAFTGPVRESRRCLSLIAEGNVKFNVEGEYKGEFLKITQDLEKTGTALTSYIEEISRVISQASHSDLDVSIDKEFHGDFITIKESLNLLLDTYNNVVSDVRSASEQVAVGSKQISESSMSLADGASQQSITVSALTSYVAQINESSHSNAENTVKANDLAGRCTLNAKSGNEEMKIMLVSMDDIKTSSNNISNIIKVIDDIAFQTNLLALNAAVEAARAGEHGKGFAVVAEEVRALASRSANAAKETAELIEDSIKKVNEGMKMAAKTATALETIVNEVGQVSSIIGEISEASIEQVASINQVKESLLNISDVVISNSAVSEESAAASEELSSQAVLLNDLVSGFNLKKYR